ncbi:ABC transporter substrate-binding protein [Aureimonas fodinaquatilis]|uniref:ABC transporter substrate-binding protein n=1 Tax=Aureimonas fodinaquatilis TaxID=2565783 RepID=UPI00165DB5F6|nr:ABC transporter substrate-binding protein [Aureimonas fodinaquatilis]
MTVLNLTWQGFLTATRTTGVAAVLALGVASGAIVSSALATQADEPWMAKVTVDEEAVSLLPENIQNSKKLVNGLNAAFPPFEYFDEDGTTIIGMDVDLAKAMAATLGVDMEIVHASFPTLIPGLTSGRYDILFSSFGNTVEREKVMDFVNYRTTGTYLISKKGNPSGLKSAELCGEKIAVVGGSTQMELVVPKLDEQCAADGKPAIDIVRFPESSDAPAAVNSGRADGALIPSPQALYLVSMQPDAFEIPDSEQIGQSYSGITVPKGSPLVAPLERALNTLIENGVYGDILEKWNMTSLAVPEAVINGAAERAK